MTQLTDKQAEVLEFIRAHLNENGLCPSSRMIQMQFCFASQTGAVIHINALIKKGKLRKCQHSGRILLNEERIPWEDVKPLLKALDTEGVYSPGETFYEKYPHLK